MATNVSAMVVPGSGLVKQQAEAEGLDAIFKAAGFEWREPGCSMCLAMNADKLAPGSVARQPPTVILKADRGAVDVRILCRRPWPRLPP